MTTKTFLVSAVRGPLSIALTRTLVLVLLLVPSLTSAQERARGNWVFGVEIGQTGSRPDAFTNGWLPAFNGELVVSCSPNKMQYLGINVGRRAWEWLHVDAVVSAQVSSGSRCAFTDGAPEKFSSGQYLGKTPGNDYFATMLRAVIEPGSSILRPRAVVGLGYIPVKDVPLLAVGAGVSAGGSRTRFVSEFGFSWPRVKWSRTISNYEDWGETLVREWTESGTSTRRQFYGRIGVEF